MPCGPLLTEHAFTGPRPSDRCARCGRTVGNLALEALRSRPAPQA